MPSHSVSDWLTEQEQRRRPSVFILEWAFIFALAGVFWTATLSIWQHSRPSSAAVVAISAFYASAIVYLRLFNVTRCRKCSSLMPLLRQEIERRHVCDREECMEIECGGVAWEQHFIDLYSRMYRVDKVRFRCRRCHEVWEELEELPASDYEFVRTIDLRKYKPRL